MMRLARRAGRWHRARIGSCAACGAILRKATASSATAESSGTRDRAHRSAAEASREAPERGPAVPARYGAGTAVRLAGTIWGW